MDTLKTQICDALAAFIRQRPGLDWRNYYSNWTDKAGIAAYRSEQRSISRDKRDAETLLQAVRWRDSITAQDILKASASAFAGRLQITVNVAHTLVESRGRVEIDYCIGQYWPTEYRKAVAAVCAAALWEWMRDNMPKPDMCSHLKGEDPGAHCSCTDMPDYDPKYDGVSAGDWLRRNARREFGSKLQRRWFN